MKKIFFKIKRFVLLVIFESGFKADMMVIAL